MLEKNLKKYFNFSEFRSGQKEVVEAILKGEDVVALMPTGGGKSLCYQLPAILNDKVTVVISPLIALMKDQVESLTARGITATFINSSLNSSEIAKRIDAVRRGRTKILYVAPERFGSFEFRKLFSDLEIFLLAVDEAHCVSQWGHDFRPDYSEIKNYVKALKKRPIVAAFTATATPEVKEDIIQKLELQNPKVFVRGFDRPNLKFFVQKNIKPKEKYLEVLRLVKSMEGSGIIYTLTRKETENLAQFLRENKVTAAAYHAGMSAPERDKIQSEFMDNKFEVIVATIAFGMGVDKADVRFVIHCGMPSSLEGYYQEAGRAGRDGESAYCILLHGKKDTNTHKFFIRGNVENMRQLGKGWEEINRVTDIKYDRLNRMLDYVEEKYCRRKTILEYFDDSELENMEKNCQGCDVCLKWKKKTESDSGFSLRKYAERQLLSGTVKESVGLYKNGHSPEQIAKIRSLGVATILSHLIDWYAFGGELAIEDLVTSSEENQILEAISRAGGVQELSPIKELLPENISYEKIKLVVVKMQRTKQ
jgi:ATP-dependent DNA helicase RecQ